MTNQLPFWLEYGQGLNHLGLEPLPSTRAQAYDKVRDAIKRGNLTHAIYSGTRRDGMSMELTIDNLTNYQELLMREQFDPQLDKYFTGGEYNGKTELLRPSRQGFLSKRA